MSLNVGGIYVRTADRERVVAAIRKHWLAVGAKPLTGDPLELDPLSVQKTGKLGYVVCPPADGADGATWVGVYDSERYHGSEELARFLADELDVLVAFYALSGSVDMASLATYRGKRAQASWHADSDDWDEIEAAMATLPYPFLYYNKLRDERGELADFTIFGFEGMPHRADEYRGPSVDEQRGIAAIEATAQAIARGDVSAVRAAYQANEGQRYEILTKVTDSKRRDVVLAFADELLADAGAYWRSGEVAEHAFLAGERELFARACQVLGRHVSRLESLARNLTQQGDHARAVEVLRAIVADDSAPLTAWNNLAFALQFVNPLPPDTAALLAGCDAHGAANSYIFHNTACVWLRVGDHAHALAAVRGAVLAGYPDLAKLRVDSDLAPLHDDPRWREAFEAPITTKPADLVVEKKHKGKTYVVQRPILAFDFFLEPLGPAGVGPHIAALLEAYLAELPAGALESVRRNGPWKKLVKASITRDLNLLKKAKASDFIHIDYRGATDDSGGAPTDYGVHVDVWGTSAELGKHDHVPVVSVWFPAAQADGDVDAVAARFERYCALAPVEAGGAGLRVALRKSDYVETWWESGLLASQLARFKGSEHHPRREWYAGHTAGAMWLSFVGHALLAKLGGQAALAQAVAPARVDGVGSGVCIRASYKPGLGVGDKPADLGALPKVARALAPLAIAHESCAAHYVRLHDVAEAAYVNGTVVAPDPTPKRGSPDKPKPKARRKR
jgi:hypothetical protein